MSDFTIERAAGQRSSVFEFEFFLTAFIELIYTVLRCLLIFNEGLMPAAKLPKEFRMVFEPTERTENKL